MKKLFSSVLCLFLLISLTGCISLHHKALSHYGESPIAEVGLYELPAPGQSFWEESGSNLTLAKQLPKEQVEDFITEVQRWRYTDTIILLPVAQDPNMDTTANHNSDHSGIFFSQPFHEKMKYIGAKPA